VKPGDVLSWKGFTFDDGGVSDKLLVIIGVGSAGDLLMLKTTSQTRHYRPDADGCHHDDSVHRFKAYLAGFRIPTWVQFDPPIIRAPAACQGAGAHILFSLKPSDLNAIVNCYRRSPDFSAALGKYLPR
jgi:hypothetical protein